MSLLDFLIPVKLGLESVTAEEIRLLGYAPRVLNGEIHVTADETALARLNLWLRTAERVFQRLAEFPAKTFDELFDGVKKIDWARFIPADGRIRTLSKCINSDLYSDRTVQSIAKKAIIESLKKTHVQSWFSEEGDSFKIHIEILGNQARVLLDSSGTGLHKRGYRARAGVAPLRETIAAAMVILSGWRPPLPLVDPCCGSGTIPIEATLIGCRKAPGLNRSFAAEVWPWVSKTIWKKARAEAHDLERKTAFMIEAFDADADILSLAAQNARVAGVAPFISFQKRAIEHFDFKGEKGMVIANPPYGERLEDLKTAETVCRELGKVAKHHPELAYFILSPHPEFSRLFGRKPDKNRKIYNGKIKCYLYEYRARFEAL